MFYEALFKMHCVWEISFNTLHIPLRQILSSHFTGEENSLRKFNEFLKNYTWPASVKPSLNFKSVLESSLCS